MNQTPDRYPNPGLPWSIVDSMSSSILLIEDSPDDLAIHWRFLRRTFPTATVITAETASRAIAILATDGVDLVVSDYWLGSSSAGTGGDVLQWLRRHRPDLEDRFVFLTGSPSEVQDRGARVMMKGTPAELMRNFLTGVMAGTTT